MKLRVGFMAAALLVIAACGQDASTQNDDNEHIVSSEKILSEDELNDVLLTVEDFPSGYREVPPELDYPDDVWNFTDGSDECIETYQWIFEDEELDPHYVADASAAFSGGEFGPNVGTAVVSQTQLDTGPESTMVELRRVLDLCDGERLTAVDAGETWEIQFAGRTDPELGDDSVIAVFRFNYVGFAFQFTLRYGVVRVGSHYLALSVLSVDPGMTNDEFVAILETGTERLEAAVS